MRPTATCLIRNAPNYRHDAFHSGLEKVGFTVSGSTPNEIGEHDILVVWNRHDVMDRIAQRYVKAGKQVVVVENGYIGNDSVGRQLYAMAMTHHNGRGEWTVGAEDRWSKLGVDVYPWRGDGEHILVLPQRGIGAPGVAMPFHWPQDVCARLKTITKRPIRLRHHPRQERPSLDPDLTNAWAAVTWGSAAGIKSIIAGIPVFHELNGWIGAPAAKFGLEQIENPFVGDRAAMFHQLSWAQWTVDEIAKGEPFRWLLGSPSTKSMGIAVPA